MGLVRNFGSFFFQKLLVSTSCSLFVSLDVLFGLELVGYSTFCQPLNRGVVAFTCKFIDKKIIVQLILKVAEV